VSAQDKAADLLVYYLRTVWGAAGLRWDEDNEAEVRNLVDWLGAAAEDAARAVRDEVTP
jgi:hypothetical protein